MKIGKGEGRWNHAASKQKAEQQKSLKRQVEEEQDEMAGAVRGKPRLRGRKQVLGRRVTTVPNAAETPR